MKKRVGYGMIKRMDGTADKSTAQLGIEEGGNGSEFYCRTDRRTDGALIAAG